MSLGEVNPKMQGRLGVSENPPGGTNEYPLVYNGTAVGKKSWANSATQVKVANLNFSDAASTTLASPGNGLYFNIAVLTLVANSSNSVSLVTANGSATLNSVGDFTITAPSSGRALTVAGVASYVVAEFDSASAITTAVADVITTRNNAGTANAYLEGANYSFGTSGAGSPAVASFQYSGGQMEWWQVLSGTAYQAMYIAPAASSAAGGLVVGSPTGGNKGAGTVNAAGLYINGSLCSTGGSPGGSNTDIQFNNSSVFGGSGNLTWDNTNQILTVTGKNGSTETALIASGQSATSAAGDLVVTRAGSTINSIAEGPNLILNDTTNSTETCIQNSGGQTEIWQYNGSWHQVAYFATNAALVVNAPTSGSGTSSTITAICNSSSYWGLAVSNTGALAGISLAANGNTINTTDFEVYQDGSVANLYNGANGAMTFSTNGIQHFSIAAAGQCEAYEPNYGVAALANAATTSSGSFTGTLTGMTTTVTGTVYYTRNGSTVTLYCTLISGTSNANTLTMTGLPSGLQPVNIQQVLWPYIENNSAPFVAYPCQVSISGGTLTFYYNNSVTLSATGFTSSGTKGVQGNITYSLL